MQTGKEIQTEIENLETKVIPETEAALLASAASFKTDTAGLSEYALIKAKLDMLKSRLDGLKKEKPLAQLAALKAEVAEAERASKEAGVALKKAYEETKAKLIPLFGERGCKLEEACETTLLVSEKRRAMNKAFGWYECRMRYAVAWATENGLKY